MTHLTQHDIGSLYNYSWYFGTDFATVDHGETLSKIFRTKYNPRETITRIENDLDVPLDTAKEFLGIDVGDTSMDTMLTLLIIVSKQLADGYCNNEFRRWNAETCEWESIAIPDAVLVGVLQLLKWLFEDWQNAKTIGSGGESGSGLTGPVTKERAGDLEVTYGASSSSAIANTSTAKSHVELPHMAQNILKRYKMPVGG